MWNQKNCKSALILRLARQILFSASQYLKPWLFCWVKKTSLRWAIVLQVVYCYYVAFCNIYIYICIYKTFCNQNGVWGKNCKRRYVTNKSCFFKKAEKRASFGLIVNFPDFGQVKNKFEHQKNKLESSRNNWSDPERTPSHVNITG